MLFIPSAAIRRRMNISRTGSASRNRRSSPARSGLSNARTLLSRAFHAGPLTWANVMLYDRALRRRRRGSTDRRLCRAVARNRITGDRGGDLVACAAVCRGRLECRAAGRKVPRPASVSAIPNRGCESFRSRHVTAPGDRNDHGQPVSRTAGRPTRFGDLCRRTPPRRTPHPDICFPRRAAGSPPPAQGQVFTANGLAG